jgi:hypothetical protein
MYFGYINNVATKRHRRKAISTITTIDGIIIDDMMEKLKHFSSL